MFTGFVNKHTKSKLNDSNRNIGEYCKVNIMFAV